MLAKLANLKTRLVCAPLNEIEEIKDFLGLHAKVFFMKFGNLTLLFCRGRHRIVHLCVSHVLHACLSSIDQ